MKKNEKKMDGNKLRVEDFPLQMNCQVQLEEYQSYAIQSSEELRKQVKKRTVLTSAVLLIVGAVLMRYGVGSSWIYQDCITILGVLMMAYAVVDVFYQLFFFQIVLKRNIAKEYAKDPRLSREMTFCFAEDRMVSFYKGAHQGTFFYDEVQKTERLSDLLLLSLNNGKIMVFPYRVLEQADPKIREILETLA